MSLLNTASNEWDNENVEFSVITIIKIDHKLNRYLDKQIGSLTDDNVAFSGILSGKNILVVDLGLLWYFLLFSSGKDSSENYLRSKYTSLFIEYYYMKNSYLHIIQLSI